MENTIPRKARLDLNTPAELAIHNAMQEVEKVGSDVKLTEAITHLSKAKDLVGEYVDTPTIKWTELEIVFLKEKGYSHISDGYANGENKHTLWKEVDNLGRQFYRLDKEGTAMDVDGDIGYCLTRSSFRNFEDMKKHIR